MSEQAQTRLGAENSILSSTKVRRVESDEFGISSPDNPSERLTESERAEELRATAAEIEMNGVGAAVLTSENRVYTGCPVGGDGWGVHAVELAVSNAVSDSAQEITDVAVYMEEKSGLCGRCLQAMADYQGEEVMVQIVSVEDDVRAFKLDELYPSLWQS